MKRIVFDEWLDLRLLDAEAAQNLIETTIALRITMDRLTQLRLFSNHEYNGNYYSIKFSLYLSIFVTQIA